MSVATNERGNFTARVHATGLGRTTPNPRPGEIPAYAAQMVRPGDLKISLGGTALEPWRIKYAGLTPGSAGLYQINLLLPDHRTKVREAEALPLKTASDEFERQIVLRVLARVGGNRSEAARILGVHRNSLKTMLERWKIRYPREQ